MAKVGVLLAGCGVFDGSEIHEAVITLLSLDQAGEEAICMAPNMEQMHVIDHLAGQPAKGEKRNVLTESARIARGKIRDVAGVKADELDALIVPGGFGAAKNLCTFATEGPACKVHPEVARIVREMHAAGKPQGFLCIAPALAAKIFEGQGAIALTIGHDPETAKAIEAMGQRHLTCAATGCTVDEKNKIVSTPAYMEARSISEAAEGIEQLVDAVLRLV